MRLSTIVHLQASTPCHTVDNVMLRNRSKARLRCWSSVALSLGKRRTNARHARSSHSKALWFAVQQYAHARADDRNLINRRNRISSGPFDFKCNAYSDADCLSQLGFRKYDVERLIPVLAWPTGKTSKESNHYSFDASLEACMILRRLASATRRRYLEEMFGKHASALSETFWEGIEHFLGCLGQLLTSCIE